MTTLARKLSMRDRLLTDHRHLETLYEKLLDAFAAGAREDTQTCWSELDNALERHLQAEENVLFPELRKMDPSEIDALCAEHAAIRHELAELGAGVDLKLVRDAVACKFIETLRAHAHREDHLLYRWADTLPSTRRRKLWHALDRSAR